MGPVCAEARCTGGGQPPMGVQGLVVEETWGERVAGKGKKGCKKGWLYSRASQLVALPRAPQVATRPLADIQPAQGLAIEQHSNLQKVHGRQWLGLLDQQPAKNHNRAGEVMARVGLEGQLS